jgi:predicted ATPase/class 3 adenylate cyclase
MKRRAPSTSAESPPPPSGVVTFLFTDIEGSTRLWERHPDTMPRALEQHDELLRGIIESTGGHVFKTVGDAFCAAFADPAQAIEAAVAIQLALRRVAWPLPGPLHVRMALHTGRAEERQGDYFGRPLNRCARIEGVAVGDQVLLSRETAALVAERLPAGASLADLGAHRLRDLARPEHVFQLNPPGLPADFPPLRSLDALPNNLPARGSSFIGREAALATVRERLAHTRLLTLKGVGGLGKTRLALQLAADMLDQFEDGVWFVELAPVTDPELLPQAVATALGVREEPGCPITGSLIDALRDQALLLVLDNCEHLVDAAAALSAALLGQCRGLKVLVTSREPLNIEGESVWPVPPLALPSIQDIATSADPVAAVLYSEAALLFVERAREVAPGFELSAANAVAVAEICRRLDGIALAIELAAARVPMMAPPQIAARLDQSLRLLTGGKRAGLPHQQTLRTAIAWSYDLCSADERLLLRRLAVFQGGWSLESATAICTDDQLDDWLLVDLLAQLANRSLVEALGSDGPDGPRYRLLETIRQFAMEQAQAAGDDVTGLRERHLAWGSELAEQADAGLRGAEQAMWLTRLDIEHDNLRAALDWAADAGTTGMGLRLGGHLWRYWYQRGRVAEGRQTLAELLALPDFDTAPADRALALHGAGTLATREGDLTQARAWLETSLAIRRELGDLPGISATLNNLAIVANQAGQVEEAQRILEENLAVQRRIGDPWPIATTLYNLATSDHEQGRFADARRRLDESLALSRAAGRQRLTAKVLEGLGLLRGYAGDYSGALAYLDQSLATFDSLGDRAMAAQVLRASAVMLRAEQRLPEAFTRIKASLAAFSELGERRGLAQALTELGRLHFYNSDLPAARAAFAESIAVVESLDDPFIASDLFDALGRLACHDEDFLAARGYLCRSLALRRDLRRTPWLIASLESQAILIAREGDPQAAHHIADVAARCREEIGLRDEPEEAEEVARALRNADDAATVRVTKELVEPFATLTGAVDWVLQRCARD